VSSQQKTLNILPAKICRHSFHIADMHFLPRKSLNLQVTKP